MSQKLQADLKTPFALHEGVRQDDTPVHKAVREALVNALVHADYTDRASVQIIKRPDGFLFRNPGLMRVPPAVAMEGGESDCRNRTLHQMFLLVGLGERAGSGLPRIRKGWPGSVSLSDSMEPYDQSRLELLLPKKVPAVTSKGGERSSLKSTLKTPDKILAAIRADNGISMPQLAKIIGVTPVAIKKQLAKLKSAGRLRRVGPAKGGHWEVVN